jgi:hypothetical protein
MGSNLTAASANPVLYYYYNTATSSMDYPLSSAISASQNTDGGQFDGQTHAAQPNRITRNRTKYQPTGSLTIRKLRI